MPDEFERHGRSRDVWETGPSRSQQRRAAAAASEGAQRKPKNMKTPKKQCTASPDGNHHSEPRLRRTYQKKGETAPNLTCEWKPLYYIRRKASGDIMLAWWNCAHVEYCSECGGKLADSMSGRCPDYPGSAEQRRKAEERTLEWERERQARSPSPWQLRKIPEGRQGYRRPKGG